MEGNRVDIVLIITRYGAPETPKFGKLTEASAQLVNMTLCIGRRNGMGRR